MKSSGVNSRNRFWLWKRLRVGAAWSQTRISRPLLNKLSMAHWRMFRQKSVGSFKSWSSQRIGSMQGTTHAARSMIKVGLWQRNSLGSFVNGPGRPRLATKGMNSQMRTSGLLRGSFRCWGLCKCRSSCSMTAKGATSSMTGKLLRWE
jgi:hypothetical protein